jgi:uncharacterized tellurite resistance protein B-like protein
MASSTVTAATLGNLTVERLEALRGRLIALGERPSMRFPRASLDIVEAMTALERYGPMSEAMYLMMAADGKVLNVEREVLRGALDIISDGQLRTAHMEAMLDAAARSAAAEGTKARVRAVIEALGGEPVKAELAVVLCAAVAVADGTVTKEERELFEELVEGLGIDESRANALLAELTYAGSAKPGPEGPQAAKPLSTKTTDKQR